MNCICHESEVLYRSTVLTFAIAAAGRKAYLSSQHICCITTRGAFLFPRQAAEQLATRLISEAAVYM